MKLKWIPREFNGWRAKIGYKGWLVAEVTYSDVQKGYKNRIGDTVLLG